MASIIVVDDDKALRKNLSFYLRSQGYEVDTAESAEEAVEKLKQKGFDVVVTDCRMGQMSGIELVRVAKKMRPATEVVVITGYGNIPLAVEAMRGGAADFICKPFEYSKLLDVIESILKAGEEKVAKGEDKYDRIVAKSPKMRDVLDLVAKAAQADVPVVIEGEPGTGKELIARAVHARSARKDGPFVVINCLAYRQEELAFRLFGDPDANSTTAQGAIAAADKGTLLIKEIEALPANLQIRLLRFLQDGYLTAGESEPQIKADVRLICSSSKSLKRLTISGHFREDLFYAINIMPIYVPPLRNRITDIFPLVNHFLEKYSAMFKKEIKALAPDVLAWMQTYSWPGNVAELENMIARAVGLATSDVIDESLVFTLPKDRPASEDSAGFLGVTLRENQNALILRVLRQTGGNYSRAAQQLGISRTTLWRRMKKFRIEEAEVKAE